MNEEGGRRPQQSFLVPADMLIGSRLYRKTNAAVWKATFSFLICQAKQDLQQATAEKEAEEACFIVGDYPDPVR